MDIPDITRPPADLVTALRRLGAASAAGTLAGMGLRDLNIHGPVSWNKGKSIAGPALTLQFMPKREDLYGDGEYNDPEKQLHRHVLYKVQPGDVVVVDARGDMTAGIFGEMMLTYFKGRGGAGMIVDGCIRDWPNAGGLDLPLWIRGLTPNFHTQTGLMPFAVNVPIACGGVTVIPGDIVVADDDGAVVVPSGKAQELLDHAKPHAEWEEFSKLKLSEGGDLRRYYPLSPEAEAEYREWRKANPVKG